MPPSAPVGGRYQKLPDQAPPPGEYQSATQQPPPHYQPPHVGHSTHTGSSGTTVGSHLEVLNRLRQERLGNLRPLNDFFDKHRISMPKNFQDVRTRWDRNLVYYQTNYAAIVAVLLVYVLFTNFLLFFTTALIGGGLIYIPRLPPTVVLFGKSLTHQQLYLGLIVTAVPLLWLSSAGSAIFWLVGASAVVVLGHAAMLEVSVENDFAQQV